MSAWPLSRQHPAAARRWADQRCGGFVDPGVHEPVEFGPARRRQRGVPGVGQVGGRVHDLLQGGGQIKPEDTASTARITASNRARSATDEVTAAAPSPPATRAAAWLG